MAKLRFCHHPGRGAQQVARRGDSLPCRCVFRSLMSARKTLSNLCPESFRALELRPGTIPVSLSSSREGYRRRPAKSVTESIRSRMLYDRHKVRCSEGDCNQSTDESCIPVRRIAFCLAHRACFADGAKQKEREKWNGLSSSLGCYCYSIRFCDLWIAQVVVRPSCLAG